MMAEMEPGLARGTDELGVAAQKLAVSEHLLEELRVHGLLGGVLAEGHFDGEGGVVVVVGGEFPGFEGFGLIGDEFESLAHRVFDHFLLGFAEFLELGE
jgi:hypothetical protein